MKIKRFFAKEMRLGIRQVRDVLGADAVILSNTKVEGGVEIIAAVDYDESLLQADPASADLLGQHNTQAVNKPAPREEKELAEDTFSFSSSAELPDLQLSSLKYESSVPGEIPRNEARSGLKNNKADFTAGEKPSEETKSTAVSDKGYANKIEWAQDPAILELKNEINSMRDLLEQQMSSLAWGDLSRRDPMRAKLTRCLLELGLSPAVCERVAEATGHHDDVIAALFS